MIHIELEAGDLAKLTAAGKDVCKIEELDKIGDFSFTADGNLSFVQKILFETRVQVALSVDGESLLVDIKQFSANSFINLPLVLFKKKISSVIAGKSSGFLEVTEDSRLKFDPARHLPVKFGMKKISIANGRLAMDIVLK